MKKILSLIFVGAVIAFTGCAEEPNTAEPNSADETTVIETTNKDMTENMTDINMSDEEYLINLGKQLEPGMTYMDVIDKIGEPDSRNGSGVTWVGYHRGDCVLCVYHQAYYDEVSRVEVYNAITGKTTEIYDMYSKNTQSENN